MPKRTDLKSILVIENGLIVIDQSCEIDQSCVHRAFCLKVEG